MAEGSERPPSDWAPGGSRTGLAGVQAAALSAASTGTSEIVFKTCEAIW